MSMWARVQNLDSESSQQVNLAYGENFPIEVRYALAHWIENQSWNDIDPDNPKYDTLAAQLVKDLIKEVQFKANACGIFFISLKLREAAKDFKQKYSNNPQQLVRVIKSCLQTEMRIIQRAESFSSGLNSHMDITSDPDQEINLTLDKLKYKTQVTENQTRHMQEEQEAFVIQLQESKKRLEQIHQMSSNPEIASVLQQEKELIHRAVEEKNSALFNLRTDIVEKQQRTIAELSELQKRILDTELIQWKRRQQLAGNGALFEDNLNQIQGWCEGLADIIWQNLQLIEQIKILCSQPQVNAPDDIITRLHMLNSQITNLFTALVLSSLVIEKQPPQVIKTATKFTATARLLVGSKLGLNVMPPHVKVTIISEAQTVALLKNNNNGFGESYGQILNNIRIMEYHKATGQLSVNFKNLQLPKFKRSEKKGNETVTDEKFSLFFQTEFSMGCAKLSFKVWTFSLPVVVVVHGVQEPHAWATITWDNAFAEHGRVPFQVPEIVPWSKMAEILRTKFKAATCCELTPENLKFLGLKVLRSNQILDNAIPITWSQFCKEPLPELHFTFWEWFYAAMKTTRDHLRDLWIDGRILGFVSRQQVEIMLLQKFSGTFLVRFSESELGAVTIAWISQKIDRSEILMIEPFTSRDLAISKLADRIKDLKIVYLYPDIPKDDAFGKYYTPEKKANCSKGYVPRRMVTQLIDETNSGGGRHGFDSSPGTLQSQCSSDVTGGGYGFDSSPGTLQSQCSSDMTGGGYGLDSSPLTLQSQCSSDMTGGVYGFDSSPGILQSQCSSGVMTGNNYPELKELMSNYLPESL